MTIYFASLRLCVKLGSQSREDAKIRKDYICEKHSTTNLFCEMVLVTDSHKKRYWSPHLHLELEKKSENETHIRGLFGPDPTLWTLFMFLHFMIAGTFIVFCGIAYTHYVLKESTQWDFIVLSMMIFAWFLLYVIARQIRSNGEKQMNDLEKVFLKIIE